MHHPILYSFRRCPYAIRARLAIAYCDCRVELREVVLKDKPQEMVAISPKATVPVLQLPEGAIIDESLDIMIWAMNNAEDKDHFNILMGNTDSQKSIHNLITTNDGTFKYWLDRYKYADRYPEKPMNYYRSQAEEFLHELDQRLLKHDNLLSKQLTLADLAIFPFVRQFAHVDKTWFYSTPYKSLQAWLTFWLESSLFLSVMRKYPKWKNGDSALIFPDASKTETKRN